MLSVFNSYTSLFHKSKNVLYPTYYFLALFEISLSNATDVIINDPITIFCQNEDTFMMFKPLLIVPIVIPPNTTPQIRPFPPNNEAPPIIQAAMA